MGKSSGSTVCPGVGAGEGRGGGAGAGGSCVAGEGLAWRARTGRCAAGAGDGVTTGGPFCLARSTRAASWALFSGITASPWPRLAGRRLKVAQSGQRRSPLASAAAKK